MLDLAEYHKVKYEKATAIVMLSTLRISIASAFPDLPNSERDIMIISVIDRLARLRGWSIRREHIMSEEDE